MRITVRRMLLGFAVLVVAVVAFSLHAYRQRPEAIDAALTAQDHSPLLALGDVVDRGPSVLETIGFGLHAAVRWAKDESLVLREERDLLLPPKPGAPSQLVVTVHDDNGVPQPGAVVVVFAQAGVSRPRDGLTDADGRVRFPGLPAAEGYVVDVGVPSLLVRVQRVVHLTAGRTEEVKLQLRSAGRYAGTVTWKDSGRPVPSATVVVRSFTLLGEDIRDRVAHSELGAPTLGKIVAQTHADEHGRFETNVSHVDLRAELCWVTATDPQTNGIIVGWVPRIQDGGDTPTKDHLLQLRPVETVEGRLRTAAGGPIPGVVIRSAGFEPAHRGGWDQLPTTVSDSEGRFRIRVPRQFDGDDCRFAVTGPSGPTHLVATKAGSPCEVVLQEAVTVRVVVVDVADGRPIPGAHVFVELDESDDDRPCVFACFVRADDEGVAHLPVAEGVVYGVRASALGYQWDQGAVIPEGLRARPGRVCRLRVPLARIVRFDVVGRLLGRSAAGQVEASWLAAGRLGRTTLDADGRFRLLDVHNGFRGERSWGTSIVVAEVFGRSRSHHVDPPREGAPSVVDLGDLPPISLPAWVVGRVVDEAGRPLAGASDYPRATDADGWYCISGAPGKWTSERVSFSASGLLNDAASVTGVLRLGEVRQVRTQVLRRPRPLRFRVHEANDSPANGAVVTFAERGKTPAVEREVGAGGVVEGPWEPDETIQLRTLDGASFSARRAGRRPASAPPTLLRLPARRVVEGVVVAPDGRGIAQAQVRSRWRSAAVTSHDVTSESDATSDADGRFSVVVSRDALALHVIAAGYQAARVSIASSAPPLRIVMDPVTPIPDAALDRAETLQREGIDDLVRLRRGELPWNEYEERREARREEIESLLGD